MQASQKDQLALLQKSFRHVYSQIKLFLNNNNLTQLDQFLKCQNGEIIKRLSLALLFFKKPQQGEASSRKILQDPNSAKKWGDKLPLSPRVLSELVLKLSEKLNLDEVLTFDLLDSYFITDDKTKQQFSYLTTIDKNLQQVEIESQQNIPIGMNANYQQSYYAAKFTMRDKLQSEFMKTVSDIIQNAVGVYFEERRCLLESIFLLLHSSVSNQKLNYAQQMNQADLAENLLKGLEQNANQFEVWTSLKEQKEVVIALQREEILVMKSYFQVYRHFQIPNAANINRFLKFQQTNEFRGHFNKQRSMLQPYYGDQTVKTQQTLIKDFAVLNCLNILQVHLFSEQDLNTSDKIKRFLQQLLSNEGEFRQLQQLFSDMQLTPVTGAIFLTFRQIVNLITSLDLLTKHQLQDKKNLITFDLNRKKEDLRHTQFLDEIILINETHRYYEEEFQDRRGELNFLIQDWLNLIYPYLKLENFREEKIKAQTLAFNILKKPVHLRNVWDLIDKNKQLIGAKQNLANNIKPLYHILDIFEEIMADPFEHVKDFCSLMIILCGNKYHKYEHRVLRLLKDYSTADVRPEANLRDSKSILQMLLLMFEQFIMHLERNQLSELDLMKCTHICVLIGKLISQNAILYEELNLEFLHCTVDIDEQSEIKSKRKVRGKQDLYNYQTNEPILFLLIRGWHALIKWGIDQISYPIKYLTRALSAIFKKLNLEREILAHFYEYQAPSGSIQLIEFFKYAIDNYEWPNGKYLVAESILKFISVIFGKQYPQGYLDDRQRINFRTSLLAEVLQFIYLPMVQNYFQLTFVDIKECVKFTTMLFKITLNLLNKFRDINPQYKSPASSSHPQYDPLLHFISEVLNMTQVENLLSSVLLLSEEKIDGLSTGLQNRFWVMQLQEKKIDSKQRNKLNKLVTITLQCYNTLLELVKINATLSNLSQEDLNQVNARTYYIYNLQCVQNMTNYIQIPGQGPQLQIQSAFSSESTCSLFSLIQQYIRPFKSFTPSITQIHNEALRFVINCCQIWEIPSQRPKVSLESIIRTNGISQQDVKRLYFDNFIDAQKKLTMPLCGSYLSSFLDLLTIAATSQQSFVEEFFKDQDFSNQFLEFVRVCDFKHIPQLKEISLYLAHEVQQKLVIFLSEVSFNRICNDFMKKLIEANMLKVLFDNVILRVLPQIQNRTKIVYKVPLTQDPFAVYQAEQANLQKDMEMHSIYSAQITLKYYFRLLQDEYSRNLENQNVKVAIANLFNESKLTECLVNYIENGDEVFSEIVLNLQYLNDPRQRNQRLAEEYKAYINMNQLLSKQQAELMNSSKIVTSDSKVSLNNLDAQKLFLQLTQLPLYSLMPNSSSFLSSQKPYGSLGTSLYLNKEEITETMRNYFYSDEEFVTITASKISQYNALISYQYTLWALTESIKNFILSIGRARTRENLRVKEFILKDKIINTSLFALVESKNLNELIANEEAVKGVQHKLSRLMIGISNKLIEQVVQKVRSQSLQADFELPQIFITQKQFESELDYLCVILGVINSISSIGTFSQDNLKQLSKISEDMVKILPNIRIQQQSQISQRQQSKILRVESEIEAIKLYVNLVLQVFSLCKIVKQARDLNNMKENQVIMRDIEGDIDYLHILSQILPILSEGICLSECLKILEQSLSFILPENTVMFMKRGDSPLRIIVQKFINSQTTVQDQVGIIQFLISYSRIEQGSEHLNQENILYNLCTSSIIQKVNSQDLYQQDTSSDWKRSPSHILWCQILLFIRTLNSKLIHDLEYRKTISTQLKLFEQRALIVLEIGAQLESTPDPNLIKKSLSLALFEEIELISGCVQQLMEFVDLFDAQDFQIYFQIKDRLLFSLTKLFSQELRLKPSSISEQYLNSLQHERLKENIGQGGNMISVGKTPAVSGLDMMLMVEKIRIFLNMNSALLSILLLNQQEGRRGDLVNTWDPNDLGYSRYHTARKGDYDNMSMRSHSVYSYYTAGRYPDPLAIPEYEGYHSLSMMGMAVENYNQALAQMSRMFKFWVLNEQTLAELFKDVYGLLKNDDWINNEYLGLNYYLSGSLFKEIQEEFETSLQMGHLVSLYLVSSLAHLRDFKSREIGGQTPVSFKAVMDEADKVKKNYADFIGDARSSKIIKQSVGNHFIEIMKQVVEDLKQVGVYDEQDMF